MTTLINMGLSCSSSSSSSIQRLPRGNKSFRLKSSLVLLTTFVILWSAGFFLLFSQAGDSTNGNQLMVKAQSLSSIYGTSDGSSNDFLTQLILGSALDDEEMGTNSDGTACVNQVDETDIDYYQSLIDSTSFYYLKLDSACEVVTIPVNITANVTLNNGTNSTFSSPTTNSIVVDSGDDYSWLIADGYLFEKTKTTFCDQASMEAQMDEDAYFKLVFSNSLSDTQDLFASTMDLSSIVSGLGEDEYTVIDCSVPVVVVNTTLNSTSNSSTITSSNIISSNSVSDNTDTGFDVNSLIFDDYLYEPKSATFCDQASLEAQQQEDLYLKMLFSSASPADLVSYVDLNAMVVGLDQEYTLIDCSVPAINLTSNSTNSTVSISTISSPSVSTSTSQDDDIFSWLVEPYLFGSDSVVGGSSSADLDIKEFCDQASLDAQQLSDSLLRMSLGSTDYSSFTELVDLSTITNSVSQIQYVLKDCTITPVLNSTNSSTTTGGSSTTQVNSVLDSQYSSDSFDWLITGPFLFDSSIDGSGSASQVKEFCEQTSLDAQQLADSLLRMSLGNGDYESLFTDLIDISSITTGVDQIEYILKDCTVSVPVNNATNSTQSSSQIDSSQEDNSGSFDWLITGSLLFDSFESGSESGVREFCDQESLDAQQLSDSLLLMQLDSSAIQHAFTDLVDVSSITSVIGQIEYVLKDCSIKQSENTTSNSTTPVISNTEETTVDSYDWTISGVYLFENLADSESSSSIVCDQTAKETKQVDDLLYGLMLGIDANQMTTSYFTQDLLTGESLFAEYQVQDCSIQNQTNSTQANSTIQEENIDEDEVQRDWWISEPILFASEPMQFCDEKSQVEQQAADLLYDMMFYGSHAADLYASQLNFASVFEEREEPQYTVKSCGVPEIVTLNNKTIEWAIQKLNGSCIIGSGATIVNCQMVDNSTVHLSNTSFLNYSVSSAMTSSYTILVSVHPDSSYSNATQVIVSLFNQVNIITQLPNIYLVTSSNQTILIGTYSNNDILSFALIVNGTTLQVFLGSNLVYTSKNFVTSSTSAGDILVGRSSSSPINPFSGDLLSFSFVPSISNYNLSEIFAAIESQHYYPPSDGSSSSSPTEVLWAITKEGSNCKIGQAIVQNCSTSSNSTLLLSNSSFVSLSLNEPLTDSFIVSVVAKPTTTSSYTQVLLDIGSDLKVVVRFPYVILIVNGVETVIYTLPSDPSSISPVPVIVQFSDPGLSVMVNNQVGYQNSAITQIPNANNILIGRSDDLLNAYPFVGELSFFELLTNNVTNQTLANVVSSVASVVSSTSTSSPTTTQTNITDIAWSITKNGSDCMVGQAVVKNCATSSSSSLLLSNDSFISLNLPSPLTDSFIVSVVAKPTTTTSDTQVLLDIGTDLKVVLRYPNVVLIVNGVETVVYSFTSTSPNGSPSTPDATSFVVQFSDPGLSLFVDGTPKYQNPAITQIPNSINILIGRSDDMPNVSGFNGELSFFELLTNNVNNQTLTNIINTVQTVVNNQDSTTNSDITWSITKEGSDCKVGQAVVKNCSPSSNSTLLLSSDSYIALNLTSKLSDSFIVSVVAKPTTTTSDSQVLLDIGTDLKVIIRYPNVILIVNGVETVIYTYPTNVNPSISTPDATSFVVQFSNPGLSVFIDGSSTYQNPTISQIPNSNSILIGRSDDLPNAYPFVGELSFFELLTNNVNNQTLNTVINTVQTVTNNQDSTTTQPPSSSTNNTEVVWSITKDGSDCKIGQAVVKNCATTSNSSLLLSDNSFIALNLTSPLTDSFIVSVVASPSTTTSNTQVLLDIGTDLKVVIRYPHVILIVNGVETVIYTYPTSSSSSSSAGTSSSMPFIVQFSNPGLSVLVNNEVKYQDSAITQIPNSNNILIGRSDDLPNAYPFNGELSFFELLTNNVNNQTLENVMGTVANVVSSTNTNPPSAANTTSTDIVWTITKDGSDCKVGQAVVKNCATSSSSSLLLSDNSFVSLNLTSPLIDSFIVSVVAKPSTTTNNAQVLLDIGTDLKVVVRYPNVVLIVNGVEQVIYTYPTSSSSSSYSPDATSFVVQFSNPGLSVIVDGTPKYQNPTISQIPNSNNILIGRSDDMPNAYPFNGELSFFELLTSKINNQTLTNIINTVQTVVNNQDSTTNSDITWSITKDGSDCKVGQAVVKNCSPASNSTLLLSSDSYIALNLTSKLSDSFIVSVVAKPTTTTSDSQVLLDIGTDLKVVIRYPNVVLIVGGVEQVIYTYPTTTSSNGIPSTPDATSFVVQFSNPGLTVFIDGTPKYQNSAITQIPNSNSILIGRSDDLPNAYPFVGELSFFELLTNNVNNQTLTNIINTVQTVANNQDSSNSDITWSITKEGSDCKVGQAVVKNCSPASSSSLLLSDNSFVSLNLPSPLADKFIVSLVAKPSTTLSDSQVLLDIGTDLKVIVRYPNVVLIVGGVETIIYTYPTTSSNGIPNSSSPDATSFVVQFSNPGLTIFIDGTPKYQNPTITQIPNSNNILIGRSDDMPNTYPFNGELSFFELLTNNVNNQTLNNIINTVQTIVNNQDSTSNPDIIWSITKEGSDCKIGQAVVHNCTTTSSSNSSVLLSSDSFVSLDLNEQLTDNFALSLIANPSITTNTNPQVLLDVGTGFKVFLNPQNVSLSLLGSDTVIYTNSSLQSYPVAMLVEFTDPGLVVFIDSKVVYQDNTASLPNSDNILIGRTNDLPNAYPFSGELVYFELLTNNVTQQTVASQMNVINSIVQTITSSKSSNTTTSQSSSNSTSTINSTQSSSSTSNNNNNNNNTNNNTNTNTNTQTQEPAKIFCFGISQNSSLACNGNGNCASNNTCSCSDNYVGTQCESPLCFGSVNCTNGVCVGPDTCKCNPGHTGSKCQYSTFADQCSGSFARAFGPTVTNDQLVYEMVLVDAKCGKTIVMQSEVLLEKVSIPENQTLQELITTTKSPNGIMIMTIDPSIHKQPKDSLVFALISLQESSFNATVKTLSTLDSNQQPTSGYVLGQSKVLYNKLDQSFAITSETNSNQAQLYSVDFDSNTAKLVNNLGNIDTNNKFLLGGNIVFDPITNTSTYSFIIADKNGKNVMATVPLTSTTTTTPVETVSIPFTENTVFSMAVANTDTKEQFLISVGTNGTEIVSVIPSLKAENVTFISLDTDGDFSLKNVENLIVDTQNNKITLTNTEDSTSIVVELTSISTEDPFQGVSKMIAETDSSFSFVAETTPVYSVEIKKFSKLYLPVSGGTTITFEGNLDVSFKPTLGVYLIFSVDNLFTQRLSIQKTDTKGVYQVNTKEMKNLPSQLADLNSFQVDAKVEIVDFKSSSAEPLLEVPYNDYKFTVYSNRINNVSPVLGYIGDEVIVKDVFVPENKATVKLSNTDDGVEMSVDAERVSSSSIKFKIPKLNIETVLLDLQLSIENDIYSSITQTKFRYVSPAVQEESASNIFSTSTSVDEETVSSLPQTAGIPVISKIELPKSRDGSAMVFKPNINSSLCSDMPVLRQYVSSSKKFDISKVISFKIILPTKFTSGNLFEVWFTKVDHLFVSLSYEGNNRKIYVNDTLISEPCSYDLGETYEFRMTYSDQKYTVKLIHDVLGTVCDASYKTSLNDFTNYTMSVGQAFNCKNLTTQIDSLTSFALYDVAEKTPALLADIHTEPLDVLALALGIPLFLVGLVGVFLAAGVIAFLWRRYRRKSKFGKFVYYNETNMDRERTIADLFEKISSEPSSSDSQNQTTETEGFADLDDLSYGSFNNNTFNAWV